MTRPSELVLSGAEARDSLDVAIALDPGRFQTARRSPDRIAAILIAALERLARESELESPDTLRRRATYLRDIANGIRSMM